MQPEVKDEMYLLRHSLPGSEGKVSQRSQCRSHWKFLQLIEAGMSGAGVVYQPRATQPGAILLLPCQIW